METVADLLRIKPHRLVTILSSETVEHAMRQMREHSIHSLLVVEEERLIGIMTDKDFLRKVVSAGLNPANVLVASVMTTKVVTVTPQESIQTCIALMADNTFHHVPVCDGHQLAGMVSWTDIMEHVLTD
jgi:CBS domain-containing protein